MKVPIRIRALSVLLSVALMSGLSSFAWAEPVEEEAEGPATEQDFDNSEGQEGELDSTEDNLPDIGEPDDSESGLDDGEEPEEAGDSENMEATEGETVDSSDETEPDVIHEVVHMVYTVAKPTAVMSVMSAIPPVATIDGAEFSGTLNEAVESAPDGAVISLLQDVELDQRIVCNGDVTLMGNGKSITINDSSTASDINKPAISANDHTLNIQDAVIRSNAKSIVTISVGTIQNVEFYGKSGSIGAYVFNNAEGEEVVFRNCTFSGMKWGLNLDERGGVHGCRIEGNTFLSDRAALIYGEAVFSENVVSPGKGVSVGPNSICTLSHNTFNDARLSLYPSANVRADRNLILGESYVELEIGPQWDYSQAKPILSYNYWERGYDAEGVIRGSSAVPEGSLLSDRYILENYYAEKELLHLMGLDGNVVGGDEGAPGGEVDENGERPDDVNLQGAGDDSRPDGIGGSSEGESATNGSSVASGSNGSNSANDATGAGNADANGAASNPGGTTESQAGDSNDARDHSAESQDPVVLKPVLMSSAATEPVDEVETRTIDDDATPLAVAETRALQASDESPAARTGEQGVQESSDDAGLAITLGIGAAVAALLGLFFIILLARRSKDDSEE